MDFEDMISAIPVPLDRAMGSAISYFVNEQEPDRVEFERATNGYVIKVVTDDDSAEEAQRLWEEEVDPRL